MVCVLALIGIFFRESRRIEILPGGPAADAPGGGGKRDIHSYDHYDVESGLSVFTAPSVKPGEHFFYADPLSQLSPENRAQWNDEVGRRRMVRRARQAAFGE